MNELQKKPFWITPAQSILPIVALALATAMLSLAVGAELPSGTGAEYMLPLVSLACLAIGVYSVVSRYREGRKWTYIKGDNVALMVKFGEYKRPERDVVDEVDDIIDTWQARMKSWDVLEVAREEVIWVEFLPAPLKVYGRSVHGYTYHATRRIVVEYKDPHQDVGHTALAHEIGHVVQGFVTAEWDEEAHHARTESLGIR